MNTTSDRPTGTSGTTQSETAKAAGSDLGQEAKAKAREFGQDVADRAKAQADTAKKGAADEISSISRALRRASGELREGSPQERTFGAAADAMADFADSVRDRDLGQMVDELSEFARRNPVGFLGGAALLGFAGVRLAKASRRARERDDMQQPGSQAYSAGASTTTARTPPAAPVGNAPQPATPGTTATGETS